ncbi:unnamed protein product [Brachionus calyciflorus]|uniref:Hexosyltransferase n=1 Tax=Brachionus calyciflorus TaxID=104777 RepID=A0A813YI97_9BILA|nr:unnamed protein product [Brachionus calyciflorus]
MKLKKSFLLLCFLSCTLLLTNYLDLFDSCDKNQLINSSNRIINPHVYNYTLNSLVCGENKGKNLLLISLVCISPQNFDQRQLIRETWANISLFKSIRVVFLVGLPSNKTINDLLVLEKEKYNDIVQENFIDTYYNLTLKTIMGLKWVSEFCPMAKFTLKIDDDVVVNTPELIKYLQTLSYTENYYMGSLQKNARVRRNKESKWKMTYDEYQPKCYVPYHQGPAYILSTDMTGILFNLSQYNPLFKLEDVFMGMLISQTEANVFQIKEKYFLDSEYSLYYAKKLNRKNNFKLFAFTQHQDFRDIWNIFYNLSL